MTSLSRKFSNGTKRDCWKSKERNKLENYFNSRMFTQIHTTSMVQEEVGGGWGCFWWNKIKGFLLKAKSFRNTATYHPTQKNLEGFVWSFLSITGLHPQIFKSVCKCHTSRPLNNLLDRVCCWFLIDVLPNSVFAFPFLFLSFIF